MTNANVLAKSGRAAVDLRVDIGGQARQPAALYTRRLKFWAVMAAADTLAALGSLALAGLVLRLCHWPVTLGASQAIGAVAFLICLSAFFGTYDPCRSSPVELFRLRVLLAVLVAVLVTATVPPGPEVTTLLVLASLLSVLLVILGESAMALARRLLIRLGLWQMPIVLIGESAPARELALLLESTPELGFRLLTHLPADDPRLGQPSPLTTEPAELAIVMAGGDVRDGARLAARLDYPSVVVVSDVGDMQTLWLNSRTIGGATGIEIRRSSLARSRRMKRAVDLMLGSVMAAVALPLVAGAALAVWAFDGKLPFYAQTRIGIGGRLIRVWKIRSMFADAEGRLASYLADHPEARAEWMRSYKLTRDPRILPGLGHWIRRTSLDELPQFWNVLKGDMSLVGPRPFPPYHLSGFDQDFQNLRCSVIPGLTGLWQITSRSDGDLVVQQTADSFYVRNWSLWFDLYILFHTMPAILFGKGAR